jgi:hypothetical protein
MREARRNGSADTVCSVVWGWNAPSRRSGRDLAPNRRARFIGLQSYQNPVRIAKAEWGTDSIKPPSIGIRICVDRPYVNRLQSSYGEGCFGCVDRLSAKTFCSF